MSPLFGTLTGTVLLLVGLVLSLLAGLWWSRRLLLDRQTRRPTKRGEFWSGLLVLLGFCGPQFALRLADLKDRDWAATRGDWAWLIFLAALTCLSLWRLPSLWRAARAERLADATKRPSGPPSLRLQLLLIVLPVVGLALIGVVSLARDQAAVEADARREAEEVARELVGRLSGAWPSRLGDVELAGHVWIGNGVVGPAKVDWPGEGQPNLDPSHVADQFLERGRQYFRNNPQDVLPVAVRFAADGALAEPQPFPAVPRPSRWSRNLTGDAATAWDNLKAAELDHTHPERLLAAVEALGAATEEPAPNRQVEFLLLRNSPADEPATVAKLIGLGRRAVRDRLETEQGLPLGVVALAEAARRSPEARLEREWFWLLGELTFQQPSSLTPWVLNLGDELAERTGDPKQGELIGELRARWAGHQRLRELAGRLTELLQPTPPLHGNRWLTNHGAEWLAVIQPGVSFLNTSTNGLPLTLANRETQVRFFRADTLELAAFNGLHSVAWVNGRERITPPRLPAGLALSLELEGKPLGVPAARPVHVTPAPVLAEAAGEFRLEGVMGELNERFDAWPSRPKFTVRVHLADSAALFAAQRRQQWLFGGMILVTAGIAGIGAWQVNRAFRRQLALNAEKSNFIASVSHELRTPLASARLLAEGLASGRVEGEAKRQEYAGFLVQETRRLGALVENVLDFARIEQGRKHYQFEPTDLPRLLTSTVRLFEPLALERGVRMELKLPAHPGDTGEGLEVKADGGAIQQALVNLLDNALKHAPAGSVVTVALEGVARDGSADALVRQSGSVVLAKPQGELADEGVRAPLGWVRLSVRDAGPGIPPEDHDRIFERFFRRGSELRRDTQGVGLGLAIVKHIVAAHRGRVWVESQPGQGACFVVELPIGESGQCLVASNQSAGRNDQ